MNEEIILARAAVKNSRSLKSAAEAVGATGAYGPAVALLVLAAEEAVKGVIASYLAFGIEIDPKATETYRKSHRVRLQFARSALFVLTIVEQIDVIQDVEFQDIDVMTTIVDVFERLLKSKKSEIENVRHQSNWLWFSRANDLKQSGFYTDFGEDNVLSKPEDVGIETYRESLRVVSKVIFGARIALIGLRRMPEYFVDPLKQLDVEEISLALEEKVVAAEEAKKAKATFRSPD